MPKIDQTLWQNPYTEHGLRLPAAPGGDAWQIHEAGMTVLSGDWLHRGVCSPFWRLFYGFSAGVWITCGPERRTLDPGRIVILPAGLPFDCGSAPGVEHLWLHFSLQSGRPGTSVGVLEAVMETAGQAVAKALRQAIEQRRSEAARHLAAALLHVTFAQFPPGTLGLSEPRLQKVLAWLERHRHEPISNTHLAGQAGLGVESFIRWFRQNTGRTPAAYVAETRVREACRRLAYEDETIEQIAEIVGFKNRHHFSRVFKQYAGCGPAAFRRGCRHR